jgi:hypothetical protein
LKNIKSYINFCSGSGPVLLLKHLLDLITTQLSFYLVFYQLHSVWRERERERGGGVMAYVHAHIHMCILLP